MKASKSYKHVALIPLSDIRTLFDVDSSVLSLDGKMSFSIPCQTKPFSCKESEQFGILCSIDGQARQLLFRVINANASSQSSNTRSFVTDSMSSLSSVSTLSSSTRHGNQKADVLYLLAKAISADRCLLDQVSRMKSFVADGIVFSILVVADPNDPESCYQPSLVLFSDIPRKLWNRFQLTFDQ